MFIQALKNAKTPTEKSAIVAAQREKMRERIESNHNPNQLLKLAKNMQQICTQHPAAEPLLEESELAVTRANAMLDAAEKVAKQVRFDGLEAMQELGHRPSSRIAQMYKTHGSWTNVHARLVSNDAGGNSFRLLCANGKLELTSEHFIVKHAPFAVTKDVLSELVPLIEKAEQEIEEKQA